MTPPEPKGPPDVRALLAALAGPEWEAGHPDALDRLSALVTAHPDDPAWEAGAIAYVGRDLAPDQRVDLWIKAADLFPANPLIADATIRAAFQEGGPKAEAALAAQLARTPQDPHLLWLQASVAFEGGRPEEALGYLEKSRMSGSWKDVGGLAELGALQILEGMGEPPDPFQRFNALVRYPRPELSRFCGLAQEASDWAAQCLVQGRPQEGLRALAAVERAGAALEKGSRSLVGLVSAQNLREEALRELAVQAEGAGDVALSARVQEDLRQVEAARQRFWAWDREYRRKAAERLKPVYERLGMPYHEASALHGVDSLRAVARQLLPEEKSLLIEAGAALFGEIDAYRQHD